MQKYLVCLVLVLSCLAGACAGKDVEFRPKGQMILGGSVGNT